MASAFGKEALFVIDGGGGIVYEEHRYNIYDDVDPSPAGQYTLTHVAAGKLTGEACRRFETDPRTNNFVERLKFSTGERERLYEQKTPRVVDSR